MRSQRALRRMASALADHASRALPPKRREWARAMCSEVESIDDDVDAVLWSLGCVFASYRERVHDMVTSSRNVARWVLGLEVLVCLGPLTLMWVAALYVLGTTANVPAGILMPTTLGTVGPIGLLLAIRAVAMRRVGPAKVFAVFAGFFATLAVLQLAGVGTLWFDVYWRVLLLNSILPAVACTHLALIGFQEEQLAKGRMTASGR
jgi:hypothetical protein